MNSERPVMIMAGGTGGHVYPALAVARKLREQNVPVIWLGTRAGFEAKVVPAEGIAMEWITVSGLRGKGFKTWLLAPVYILRALVQAILAVYRHKPRAVLGMGGFAAGPGGLAAWLLRRPLVLHEQNAVVGLTNRLLAPLSHARLTGFSGAFGKRAATHVGNPVRQDIAALPLPAERFALRTGPLRLLVLGGSQGAKALNEILPRAIALLPLALRPEIRHQAGGKMVDIAERAYRESDVDARIEPFIVDMAAAYAWADLMICRSGALTVAEIAAAGVGSLLVPFPAAVDDHQTANARYLERSGAAILLPQPEFTAERVASLFREFDGQRDRLLAMAQAARVLAMPSATERVVEVCLHPGKNGQSSDPRSWPISERRS